MFRELSPDLRVTKEQLKDSKWSSFSKRFLANCLYFYMLTVFTILELIPESDEELEN